MPQYDLSEEKKKWNAQMAQAEQEFAQSPQTIGTLDYAPVDRFLETLTNFGMSPLENMDNEDGVQTLQDRYIIVKDIADKVEADWAEWKPEAPALMRRLREQAFNDYISANKQVNSPVRNSSFLSNLIAGLDATYPRMARGAQQILGIGDQEQLKRDTELDKPLMDTWGGSIGYGAGLAMSALPATVMATEATPIAAGTALTGQGMKMLAQRMALMGGIGGTEGALQPVADGESRGWNTALGAAIGGGMEGIAGVAAPVIRNVFGTQGMARDAAARQLLEEATPSARATIEGYNGAPPNLIEGAKLTTPEYMVAQGDMQPAWNVRQDAFSHQTLDKRNLYVDANQQTAQRMESALTSNFEGASPDASTVLRQEAMDTAGKEIERARMSSVPLNAQGVVNFMDNYIKKHPVGVVVEDMTELRNKLVRNVPIDERGINAAKINKEYLESNVRMSSADHELIRSASYVLRGTKSRFGNDAFDIATEQGKLKALASISRQLKSKKGKEHIKLLAEVVKTNEIPYNRVRDLHDFRKRISSKMQSMTNEQKREMIPLIKKIDNAIARESKDWSTHMQDYASLMNRASQADAGVTMRESMTRLGTDKDPVLTMSKFDTLMRVADEKFLQRINGKGKKFRIRFTPEQLKVISQINNTARVMKTVRDVGSQTNSRTAQRQAFGQSGVEIDAGKLIAGRQTFSDQAMGILNNFDRKTYAQMYKLVADPAYFAETLKNLKPQNRWAAHLIRAQMLGISVTSSAQSSGSNAYEGDYTQFMELPPEAQAAFVSSQKSGEAFDAGVVSGKKP
jgi:hypothetical protein